MLKPRALMPGDTIGIMAPSARVNEDNLNRTVRLLNAIGFKTYVHPQTYEKLSQSAGTARQKVAALLDLFADESIRAIFSAEGGNRAGYMLRDIDFNCIRDNPKIFLGFSDGTVLLNAIQKQTGLITYHGPVIEEMSGGFRPRDNLRQLFALLSGQLTPIPMENARTVRTGKAEGKLIGGNLSLVSSLVGTPWQPDFDGAILLLEDWDETCAYYDRLLMHLHNAGVFDRIGGLILGGYDFREESRNFLPFGFTFTEIINELTENLRIPVIMDAPFSHRGDLYTLPIGLPVRLEADENSKKLTLLEPAVS